MLHFCYVLEPAELGVLKVNYGIVPLRKVIPSKTSNM